MKSLLSALVLLTSCSLSGQSRIQSPEVHDDRKVTFRIPAPKATDVQVKGDFSAEPVSMRKSSSGVWSVVVGPLEPEIYEYTFLIDGAEVIDPRNREVKVWRFLNSTFTVPGNPASLHEMQDVAHGEVHHHWYRSSSLSLTRGVFVYIPPEYNSVADSKYPVLYLLHGSGDDESAWLKVGKIDHIADNLHSQEKLGPTIIVMPYGHAIPDGQRTHGKYNNGVLAFEDDLINDLIPFVEKRYRVKAESRYRAIAGLSMGGGQSLFVGLRNSDKFKWVAGFSSSVSASSADRFLADLKDRPSEVNEQLSLLWIGCGKDDFLLQRNEEFVQWLKDADIAHSYQVTEGGHQWRVWRKYAAEILVQLWK